MRHGLSLVLRSPISPEEVRARWQSLPLIRRLHGDAVPLWAADIFVLFLAFQLIWGAI
jgi:hypothetical protein